MFLNGTALVMMKLSLDTSIAPSVPINELSLRAGCISNLRSTVVFKKMHLKSSLHALQLAERISRHCNPISRMPKEYLDTAHWAFIMAICFWEATFGYKSYHLSDCYRLYISCKNNIGKALNYQTDLSDWYQLNISCKIKVLVNTLTLKYPLLYPTDMKPLEA